MNRYGMHGMQQEVWTCRLWVVDRISIMYIAGGVDLFTSVNLSVLGCGQNIYQVCSRMCGPLDLWAV